MDYFEKITKNPYKDLYWNVPEGKKLGEVAVIGGNGQNFRAPIANGEFLVKNFPLKNVRVILPDSLKSKLPPLDNLTFLKSTNVGSFADAEEIQKVIDNVDYSLVVGDLSKNAITAQVFDKALNESEKPILIARDAVDLIADIKGEKLMMRENIIIFGNVMQWQKIFKSIYYPKILNQSMSVMQIVEVLHKFTLSYPMQVILLQSSHLLIAKNGNVKVVALSDTKYLIPNIISGDLAARIMAMNLYNPDKFIEATVAALFS